jgi:hypothetical protein
MLCLIAMRWTFGRLLSSSLVARSVVVILCAIFTRSPLDLGATASVEAGFLASPICASTADDKPAGDPHRKGGCRTLECCALGCSAHDAACLDAARPYSPPPPWPRHSPPREGVKAMARRLVTGLGFVARGPPALL